MPPEPSHASKSLADVVDDVGLYPIEAYEFVLHGLNFTVAKHRKQPTAPEAMRHVSGQQLCEGLREYALMQWGRLAQTVLNRWNINRTEDFGRIVFAMVDSGLMSKTEQDSPRDFRNVFDFDAAFEGSYRIECKI